MTILPELDVTCGRLLWALRKAGPLREDRIPAYALGLKAENVAEALAQLEQRGEARREGNVWSAVG